jgi:hypothetical protein
MMVGHNFLNFHFEIRKNEDALLVVHQVRIPGVALPPSAPAQPPLTWEEFGRKLELLSEDKSRNASMPTVVTDRALPVEFVCTLATIASWKESGTAMPSSALYSSGQTHYIPRALDPHSYWTQGYFLRQQYQQVKGPKQYQQGLKQY